MGNASLLETVGGVSAFLAAATLVVGIVGLVRRASRVRPWLAVMFGINAGVGDVSQASLRVINPVDVGLLLLAGITFMGFWPGPGGSQAWVTGLAIALPLAGIPLLVATRLAGRSGLMGGGFVLAVLMLFAARWVALGSVGVLANASLLVGDFALTGRRSMTAAACMGVGYVVLIGWLVGIGVRLLDPTG